MNDSRLLSQVPYQTQVAASTPDADIDDDLESQCDPAILQDDVVDTGVPSLSPEPPAHLQPATTGHAGDVEIEAARDAPESSSESIECQPFVLPRTKQPEETLQTQVFAEPTQEELQPFPLIEWIRRARADTPKRWPTFPMRWARTVSKEQRAILDQDDAWSPPLAGRPVRQGTVPIRLLKKLTEKAEKTAESRPQAKPAHPRDLPSHGAHKSKRNLSSAQLDRSPKTSNSETQSDSESDKDTEIASQWDSSPPQPPRRLAPPDTSPIRNTTFEHTVNLQIGTARSGSQEAHPVESTRDQKFTSSSSHSDEQSEADKQRSGSSLPEQSLQRHTETHINDVVVRSSARQQRVRSKDFDRSARNPAETEQEVDLELEPEYERPIEPSTKRAMPKVQVKDTPFPKPVPRSRHVPLDDNLTQTSFVNATYPVRSPARSEAQKAGDARTTTVPLAQPSVSLETSTSLRSNKRQAQRAQEIARGSNAKSHVAEDTTVRNVGVKAAEGEVEPSLPPRKRRRLSNRSNKETDPDFMEIDQRRILERRTFRQSISTTAIPTSIDEHVSKPNSNSRTSITRTSSSQQTERRSRAAMSESGRTTVTSLSFHKPANTKKFMHGDSQVSRPKYEDLLKFVLGRFKAAYPSYQGTLKAFGAAIRLIVSLKQQPKEPHPSLWDDFIYRRSSDYMTHLQQCMDEGDNALPYQDFYYARIKRSEREKGIVTEEVLISLHNVAQQIARDTAVSIHERLRPGTIAALETRHEATLALSQGHELELNKSTPHPDANVDQQPDFDTDNIVSDVLADRPRSRSNEQLPMEIDTPRERKKTRRSLPWNKCPDLQPSTKIPTTNRTEAAAPSATQSSASEKVEEWLNSNQSVKAATTKQDLIVKPLEHEESSVASLHVGRIPSRTPGNAFQADEVDEVTDSGSSVKSRKCNSLLPDNDTARFARLFARLQSEDRLRTMTRRQQPINIYTW